MFKTLLKKDSILNAVYGTLINLPTPSNISIIWNFGSLLALMLIIQIISGFFLSIHFTANTAIAFDRVIHICRNVNNGWLIRIIHSNGASFFFIFIYFHIGRGIYFNSFQLKKTWFRGIIILFLLIATAFLGYVLPWGQISFWGATVITNLLSAIPYLGDILVSWLWGGFAVRNPTLTRFFSIHFIIPFVILALIILHIIFLHETGSSNPLGLPINSDKIPFYPYFLIKDLLGYLVFFIIFRIIILFFPYILNDPDNFIPANPINTPIHIQPEWYFLFAYSILRAIPNKLGGVIALVISICILFLLPIFPLSYSKGIQFYPVTQNLFWIWVNIACLLTWIGIKPVEIPYIIIGQIISILYFVTFLLLSPSQQIWDKIID